MKQAKNCALVLLTLFAYPLLSMHTKKRDTVPPETEVKYLKIITQPTIKSKTLHATIKGDIFAFHEQSGALVSATQNDKLYIYLLESSRYIQKIKLSVPHVSQHKTYAFSDDGIFFTISSCNLNLPTPNVIHMINISAGDIQTYYHMEIIPHVCFNNNNDHIMLIDSSLYKNNIKQCDFCTRKTRYFGPSSRITTCKTIIAAEKQDPKTKSLQLALYDELTRALITKKTSPIKAMQSDGSSIYALCYPTKRVVKIDIPKLGSLALYALWHSDKSNKLCQLPFDVRRIIAYKLKGLCNTQPVYSEMIAPEVGHAFLNQTFRAHDYFFTQKCMLSYSSILEFNRKYTRSHIFEVLNKKCDLLYRIKIQDKHALLGWCGTRVLSWNDNPTYMRIHELINKKSSDHMQWYARASPKKKYVLAQKIKNKRLSKKELALYKTLPKEIQMQVYHHKHKK